MDGVGVGFEQVEVPRQVGELAARHPAGGAFIGPEEQPPLVHKIAEGKRPLRGGALGGDGELAVPLDRTGTLGAGLLAQVGGSGGEPLLGLFMMKYFKLDLYDIL